MKTLYRHWTDTVSTVACWAPVSACWSRRASLSVVWTSQISGPTVWLMEYNWYASRKITGFSLASVCAWFVYAWTSKKLRGHSGLGLLVRPFVWRSYYCKTQETGVLGSQNFIYGMNIRFSQSESLLQSFCSFYFILLTSALYVFVNTWARIIVFSIQLMTLLIF